MFSDEEWKTLVDQLGKDFGLPNNAPLKEVKKVLADYCFDLCSECHEEVLGEPIYLPSFMQDLQAHFLGKTRIQKMLVLARVLQLGIVELNNMRKK